jgi:triacylglycerol lipase
MRQSIVLVHGIDDTAKCLHKMAVFFRSKGFETFEFEYKPNDGSAPMEVLAEHLKLFIEEKVKSEYGKGTSAQQNVVLVGFSMGGIISRYYVQRLGGDARVRDLMTLSSPHKGTIWAYLLRRAGVKQMRPGSKFLKDLNGELSVFQGDDGVAKVRFISLYTPLDLMIVPAQSSRVDFALCKRMWVLAHPLMIRSKRVMEVLYGFFS